MIAFPAFIASRLLRANGRSSPDIAARLGTSSYPRSSPDIAARLGTSSYPRSSPDIAARLGTSSYPRSSTKRGPDIRSRPAHVFAEMRNGSRSPRRNYTSVLTRSLEQSVKPRTAYETKVHLLRRWHPLGKVEYVAPTGGVAGIEPDQGGHTENRCGNRGQCLIVTPLNRR